MPYISILKIFKTHGMKLWCSISKLEGNELHPPLIVNQLDSEISNKNIFSGTKRKNPDDNLNPVDIDGSEAKRYSVRYKQKCCEEIITFVSGIAFPLLHNRPQCYSRDTTIKCKSIKFW
jgi:hypothetical protein